MTNFYTTEKGKSRTNIYVAGTGEFVCQLLNKEVAPWLRRAEESIKEAAFWAQHEYEARLANVSTYLAARAARKAEASLQGNLF